MVLNRAVPVIWSRAGLNVSIHAINPPSTASTGDPPIMPTHTCAGHAATGGLAYASSLRCRPRTGGGLAHHPEPVPGPAGVPPRRAAVDPLQRPARVETQHDGWKLPRPAFEACVQTRYADARAWIGAGPPPLTQRGTEIPEDPPGDMESPVRRLDAAGTAVAGVWAGHGDGPPGPAVDGDARYRPVIM